MTAEAFVLGTAGHIDHGKSTLVKALTRIDPDRLEEEKRRGMTIDLGFAYLDLASGRRVAIVDVPGHQRFLKNMLAGVHGMDAVMLVIAADEGPMPQTREHLAIIDLLQIEHGVVVLTKSDLVDEAWLALVTEEVTGMLAGTSLAAAKILPVSSPTGRGLDALRLALDEELAKTTPRPDQQRARLPIDRAFAISGFGTVVTGTLVGGTLTEGSELAILPGVRRARIRGLQQHNQHVAEARPGTRTAVNLSGVEHSQLERGDVLAAPGSLPVTRRLDARLIVLPSATQPLKHRQRLLMYHGTAEHMLELSLLDRDELRPGDAGLAQLFTIRPVVALDGDRFILRVPSPPETVAGGIVLDVSPRRHRRRDGGALAALAARERGDPAVTATLELGKHAFGLVDRELAARLGVPTDQLAEVLGPLQGEGALRHLDSTWLTSDQWAATATRIRQALERYHRAQPLRRGMAREELRSKTGIPAELFGAALALLTAEGTLAERGNDIALAVHQQGLTADQAAAVEAFVAELERGRFSPPPLPELISRHRLTPALLQFLVGEGRVVRLDAETAFARSAYDQAVGLVRTYLRAHGTLTVAVARDLLGSSRRYVLPLLEWLDAQKITRRVGDDRILRD